MQPFSLPAHHLPPMQRMVGWSAALHAGVFLCLLLAELFSPRPMIFRDVIQVDLVPKVSPPAVQTSAPPPKPPQEAENPLWSKLEQPPAATPSDAADSLVDDWNKLGTRTPAPVTPPRDSLSEWWKGEMRDQPADEASADVAPAEEARLRDLWEQINAESPSAAQSAQSEWWKEQENAVLAPVRDRQMHATAEGGTPRYLAVVERRVSVRWSPPDIFRNRDAVQVTLSFRLSKDGRVREAKVVTSSGSLHYDQAAVRAVLTADPFPAFPDEIREPYLNIRFTFTLDRDGLS